MKTIKENIQKDEMTDLAWKELMDALQPTQPAVKTPVKNEKTKTKHHPAIITTQEMSNWEFFG